MRMNNLGIVTRNIQRADPPTVARLSRFGVAIIYNMRGLLAAAGPEVHRLTAAKPWTSR